MYEYYKIKKLRDAIEDPGRNPGYHYGVMAKHRKEWPTLWKAIDELLEK